MKKFLALAVLLPTLVCAQEKAYSMIVSTTDGRRDVYPTSQVSAVDFAEADAAPQAGVGRMKVNRNIVFLGHSIWRNDGYAVTYGNSGTFVTPFSGSFRGVGYQTLLQQHFEFLSATSLGPNGGYSGYSLGGTSATDSKSIAVVAQNSANGWPKVSNAIWTIDFITNDFKRNVAIGKLTDYQNNTGAASFYGALRILYDRIKALSGNDVVIVCANALKRNNSNYTSTSRNTVGHTLDDYELALLTVAAQYSNWYFVDQNRQSGITDENLPAVTADGLHLNNLGYRMAVVPWIKVLEMVARQ